MGNCKRAIVIGVLIAGATWCATSYYYERDAAPAKQLTEIEQVGVQLGSAKQTEANLRGNKIELQRIFANDSVDSGVVQYFDSYTGTLTERDWQALREYYANQQAIRNNKSEIDLLQAKIGLGK